MKVTWFVYYYLLRNGKGFALLKVGRRSLLIPPRTGRPLSTQSVQIVAAIAMDCVRIRFLEASSWQEKTNSNVFLIASRRQLAIHLNFPNDTLPPYSEHTAIERQLCNFDFGPIRYHGICLFTEVPDCSEYISISRGNVFNARVYSFY